MKAIWKGQVIAQSDDTVVVEGNHYFPKSSLKPGTYRESDHQTVCAWKGTASYFHLQVDGELNVNAAFEYRTPSEAASHIKDRVAFWKGVKVE